MNDSILLSVKKALGIDQQYVDFDFDIVMNINSAIHTLYQVGYEPAKDFMIIDATSTWTDLAGEIPGGVLSLIKMYIYAKVRVLFDPPTSSFVLTSLENQMKELEWRIYAEMEGGFEEDESDEDEDEDLDDPENPWEGVPDNDPDTDDEPVESEPDGDESGSEPGDYLPDALRRLGDEMGYTKRSS